MPSLGNGAHPRLRRHVSGSKGNAIDATVPVSFPGLTHWPSQRQPPAPDAPTDSQLDSREQTELDSSDVLWPRPSWN